MLSVRKLNMYLHGPAQASEKTGLYPWVRET